MIFYENGIKYALCGGSVYTMADLRNGYRILTGLDNGHELSDKAMIKYMAELLEEDEQ